MNEVGVKIPRVMVKAGAPPGAPTLDSVTPGDARNTVAWTPPAGSPDSYNLYWSLTSPVSKASNKLTGVTSPYVHTGRTNGTPYYYAVTAVKGGLESALSNELSGTPVMAAFSITVQTTTTPQDFKLYLAGAEALRIDWGDTNEDTYTGSDGVKTHSYASPGTYTITFVSGTADRISFGGDTGSDCTPELVKSVVTPVANWLGLTSGKYMFGYCVNLTSWCADFFTIASAGLTNTERMFRECNMNEDLSAWDMSANTFMRGMFQDSNFNGNIGSWDVSHVTNMASVFYGDTVFNNGGSDSIKNWDTVRLLPWVICSVTMVLSISRLVAGTREMLPAWITCSLVTVVGHSIKTSRVGTSPT